jgi:hypothetical protein
MIDDQVKEIAKQLAVHRAPFALFGPWEIKDAFMFLDMRRFVSANDSVGNFPPEKRA